MRFAEGRTRSSMNLNRFVTFSGNSTVRNLAKGLKAQDEDSGIKRYVAEDPAWAVDERGVRTWVSVSGCADV